MGAKATPLFIPISKILKESLIKYSAHGFFDKDDRARGIEAHHIVCEMIRQCNIALDCHPETGILNED